MHADEVDISVALVERLLARQFPQWANLSIQPVTLSGTDNVLFRLGDDMVIRLPRIEEAVKHVHKEYRWLPLLAPFLPVSISVPLGKGLPGEGYPWHWSIFRWLEGENPTAGHIVKPTLFARELEKFVTALHKIDPTDGPPASRGIPLAMRDAPTRTAIEELQGMIDTTATIAAWEEALRIPEWSDPAVWVHGNLSPMNLLIAQGRLCAVIDFGSMGVGDPACDLIIAWNLLPADTRNVFRTALSIDDATWARGRGWALSIALIQLPYYQNTNPVITANAQYVIHEVLLEHKKGV
jgi:aminoglycoside phosphotransferase (APT) family kinase protein